MATASTSRGSAQQGNNLAPAVASTYDLQPLQRAVDALTPKAAAWGHLNDAVTTSKPLVLRAKPADLHSTHSTPFQLAFPCPQPSGNHNEAVAPLLACATPMSELSGRNWHTLAAGRVELTGPLPLDAICEQVRAELTPEASPGCVHAELHHVSVVTPGGFIRNTSCKLLPDSPTCFGMLEVILPTSFVKGSTYITHAGSTVKAQIPTVPPESSVEVVRRALQNRAQGIGAAASAPAFAHAPLGTFVPAAAAAGGAAAAASATPVMASAPLGASAPAAAAGSAAAPAAAGTSNTAAPPMSRKAARKAASNQAVLDMVNRRKQQLRSTLPHDLWAAYGVASDSDSEGQEGQRPGEAGWAGDLDSEAALSTSASAIPGVIVSEEHLAELLESRDKAERRLAWYACFADAVQTVGIDDPRYEYAFPGAVSERPRVSLVYALHLVAPPRSAAGAAAEAAATSSSSPTAALRLGRWKPSLLWRCQEVQHQLSAAFASRDFLPGGGLLGVQFHRPYIETALSKSEKKLREGEHAAIKLPLKNEDAVMAVLLASTGLSVSCLRMMHRGSLEYGTLSEDRLYVMDKIPIKKENEGVGGWFGMLDTAWLQQNTEGKLHDVMGKVTWLGTHKPGFNEWCKLRTAGGAEFASTVLTTLSALLVKVPPFDQRQSLRCASLTLEQVQPFKTLRVAGGKKKAAASRKGGCSKARGKRKREEEEEEEEEWELEDEEEEEEEERPAGRKGRGKRKAVEQEDDDGQQQEDEVEGGQARVATAPPNLYMPEDPTVMTAAQKRQAALMTVRKVHVKGGRGQLVDRAMEGSDLREGRATITLQPGQSLTQLKTAIKKAFGKLRNMKVGPLVLLDSSGRATAQTVKADDLVDGTQVQATYTQAQGTFCAGYGEVYDEWME